jgi:hypothetical protein
MAEMSPENSTPYRTPTGPSWRRGTAERRPIVNEERRTVFLDEIRELSGRGPRGDVMSADKRVPPLHDGFLHVGEVGRRGVQASIHGNEKLPYTVIIVVTAALAKTPITVIVKRKATFAEKGPRLPGPFLGIRITRGPDG